MLYQIIDIEFDFTTDDVNNLPTLGYQEDITNDTLGQIWEADDEEDLVEEITCATGWCIKSLNYRHVLS
jgi:hypothetical protein